MTDLWLFKGIRTDRPYPPTGLTTARWKAEVIAQWVPLRQLWLTQDTVDVRALLGPTRDGSDTYPHVVAWHGELYLEDGHHRVLRALLRNNTQELFMRVFRREQP